MLTYLLVARRRDVEFFVYIYVSKKMFKDQQPEAQSLIYSLKIKYSDVLGKILL